MLGSGHEGILQRMGIAPILEKPKESMQTIAWHVRMLTPELLDAVNKEVVAAGQRLVGCQGGALCRRGAILAWWKRTRSVRRTCGCCGMR